MGIRALANDGGTVLSIRVGEVHNNFPNQIISSAAAAAVDSSVHQERPVNKSRTMSFRGGPRGGGRGGSFGDRGGRGGSFGSRGGLWCPKVSSAQMEYSRTDTRQVEAAFNNKAMDHRRRCLVGGECFRKEA